MLKMTLKAKICLGLTILFLLEVLVLQIFLRHSYRKYDELLYEKTVQVMTFYAERIEQELLNLENISLAIIGDTDIQENLSRIKTLSPTNQTRITARTTLKERVKNYLHANEYLHTLTIITQEEDFTSTIQILHSPLQERDLYWDLTRENHGRVLWLPDPAETGSLVLVREIREIQTRSMQTLGVIVAKIQLDKLVDASDDLLEQIDLSLNVSISLNDKPIIPSTQSSPSIVPGQHGWWVERIDGNRVFCVAWQAPESIWKYLVTTNYEHIAASVSRSNMLALGLSIASMTVVGMVCLLLINSILKHFTILQKKFDAYGSGQLPALPDKTPFSRNDEISRLYRHFDRMIYDHHRMSEDIYVKQQLLHDAQIKQLKQQIHPHFLFNTLETISLLSLCHRTEEVSAITSALGKMLRTSLKEQRNLISLREDLLFAENYLRIQSIRYGDRLRVETHIDPATENALIPCTTIQPLVENSIIHALEVTIDVCVIRISSFMDKDGVLIKIEDNGPGIVEDVLDKIERKEIHPNGLGIGLANIDKRLKLLLSKECGLQFHSSPQGTCVMFRLLKGDKNAENSAC